MTDSPSTTLRKELRRSGLSTAVIDAAWPSWWSEDLSQSPSAHAELRFALARKLGLAPKPLLGERVEFVWKDRARFKHLSVETEADQQVLASFAISVGRLLTRGVSAGRGFKGITATRLRESILKSSTFVELRNLLGACWALGVPVAYLRIFPLAVKAMHAMVIAEGNVGAILLGRDASYPALVAFTLAHEIGHLALGHVRDENALVDLADPAMANDRDLEEEQADEFALTLLTGSSKPDITTELERYDAPTLAGAVLRAGPQYRIEPGTLALCVGHAQRNWPVVMSALGFIYEQPIHVWRAVNGLAQSELSWPAFVEDDKDFLRALLQLDDV